MAGPGFLRRELAVAALASDAFSPFGEVIDAAAVAAEAINDGTTDRHPDLARLDLCGEGPPVLGMYVARARSFPLAITRLEQHQRAAQAFVPLGPHRFVVVVAPGDDSPDWAGLAAFVSAPWQGLVLRRGCWHHGLVALGDGDRFAVLEGAGYRRDCREVAAPHPIVLLTPR
jgi:ureidoglycolate lyase